MVIKLNTRRLNNLADKVIDNGMVKYHFSQNNSISDTDKVSKSLLKHIKSLNAEELDYLELVISVKDNQTFESVKTLLKEELKPIKEDIAQIKKVVGCNDDA